MMKLFLNKKWLQQASAAPMGSSSATAATRSCGLISTTNAATTTTIKDHNNSNNMMASAGFHITGDETKNRVIRGFRSTTSTAIPRPSQQQQQIQFSVQVPCRYKSTAAVVYDESDEETHAQEGTQQQNSTGATTTVPFILADIGEGIKEVELLQW